MPSVKAATPSAPVPLPRLPLNMAVALVKPKAAPRTAAQKPRGARKPAVKKAAGGGLEMGKLRIRISAYENKVLDASVKQIMDTALRYDATVRGPVPLPTGIKRYTVNRASFIDKNSREQFEMRIHKRLLDILNPNPKIVESLTNLSLPSGVHIDVKMM